MPARTWASSSAGRRTRSGSRDLGAMKRSLARSDGPGPIRRPGGFHPVRSCLCPLQCAP
jgi:hypothetical protein